MKCGLCKVKKETVEIWQPFGPGESFRLLTLPGSHYRGFPAIRVCQECNDLISTVGSRIPSFEYQGKAFIFQDERLVESPF